MDIIGTWWVRTKIYPIADNEDKKRTITNIQRYESFDIIIHADNNMLSPIKHTSTIARI